MKKLIVSLAAFALVAALAAPAFADDSDPAQLTVTVPAAVTFSFNGASVCNFGIVPPGASSEQLSCLNYTINANVPWQLTLGPAGGNPPGVTFDARKNGDTGYTTNIGGSGAQVWRTGAAGGTFADDFRANVAANASAGVKTLDISYVTTAV